MSYDFDPYAVPTLREAEARDTDDSTNWASAFSALVVVCIPVGALIAALVWGVYQMAGLS